MLAMHCFPWIFTEVDVLVYVVSLCSIKGWQNPAENQMWSA